MLLWTTRMPANRATPRQEFVRFFRLNRWLTYLTLVPVAAATTLLAIFFFAVFLALFAAAIVVVPLRLWWLRRKLRQARLVENFGDHQLVITQARIVAKETDKASEQFEDHACS
jgi:uncharacterized protein (DUF58 family)